MSRCSKVYSITSSARRSSKGEDYKVEYGHCSGADPVNPEPDEPTILLLL